MTGLYIVLEGIGWGLVAFDVANTPVSPTPDAGIVGAGMITGARAKLGHLAIAASQRGAIGDFNKLRHIFGQARHGLDDLVSEFGSQQQAYDALSAAAQQVVTRKGLTGLFEEAVQVGTQTVTVRGNVVDGVAKIGTAFKP